MISFFLVLHLFSTVYFTMVLVFCLRPANQRTLTSVVVLSQTLLWSQSLFSSLIGVPRTKIVPVNQLSWCEHAKKWVLLPYILKLRKGSSGAKAPNVYIW